MKNKIKEDWNLSEKRNMRTFLDGSLMFYKEDDVKEFIKRLKEEFKEHHWIGEISHKIDKLAGEKLI